jgi:hypothetical protein
MLGGIWFLLGLIYLTFSTRGFRSTPKTVDMREVSDDALPEG